MMEIVQQLWNHVSSEKKDVAVQYWFEPNTFYAEALEVTECIAALLYI